MIISQIVEAQVISLHIFWYPNDQWNTFAIKCWKWHFCDQKMYLILIKLKMKNKHILAMRPMEFNKNWLFSNGYFKVF